MPARAQGCDIDDLADLLAGASLHRRSARSRTKSKRYSPPRIASRKKSKTKRTAAKKTKTKTKTKTKAKAKAKAKRSPGSKKQFTFRRMDGSIGTAHSARKPSGKLSATHKKNLLKWAEQQAAKAPATVSAAASAQADDLASLLSGFKF